MDSLPDPPSVVKSQRDRPKELPKVTPSAVFEGIASGALAVASAIPDVVTGLGTAIGVAEKIVLLVQQVSHNKRRCNFLATRIRLLADTLTQRGEDMKRLAEIIRPELQKLIRHVLLFCYGQPRHLTRSAYGSSHLNDIADYLRELKTWGLLKRLIMRLTISDDLDEKEKLVYDIRSDLLVGGLSISFFVRHDICAT
jgi:hypothetical protein